MFKNIVKCAVALLTVTSARDAMTADEFFNFDKHPQVELSGKGEDWLYGSIGFILGSTVEAGANVGALVPCVGQVADVAESLYFTYFYIRGFIEERQINYVSYLSVYISRGIDSITFGPCWNLSG